MNDRPGAARGLQGYASSEGFRINRAPGWYEAAAFQGDLDHRRPGVSTTKARKTSFVLAAMMVTAMALPLRSAWPQGIDMTQGGPIQITARDGLEWRQNEQVVIARGDAKAVRGAVTVTADRLIAWYRHKGNTAAPQTASTGLAAGADTEGNEVYRMRAEGNVHIYTATDQAWGDQATYDLDEAVMVMTGHALKLTTPNDTLTARDTLEYWSLKHMAVARGDAVVVTNDGRRISADTLVAYTVATPAPAASSAPASSAPGTTREPSAPARASGDQPSTAPPPAPDSMAALSGKLERVEAFNNVTVRTATDIVTGDRAVYVPDTGIARVGGHVRISRGLNQINGSEAVVNMKTGVANLLAGDTGRVTGLVVPSDRSTPGDDTTPPEPAKTSARPGNNSQASPSKTSARTRDNSQGDNSQAAPSASLASPEGKP